MDDQPQLKEYFLHITEFIEIRVINNYKLVLIHQYFNEQGIIPDNVEAVALKGNKVEARYGDCREEEYIPSRIIGNSRDFKTWRIVPSGESKSLMYLEWIRQIMIQFKNMTDLYNVSPN